VRDSELHAVLEAFVADAAAALGAETAAGAEIPFEVLGTDGRRSAAPLYCYRPLTSLFITDRLGLLSGLATYSTAVRAIGAHERAGEYLIARGVPSIPSEPRGRGDAALLALLHRMFEERSQFAFDPARFELAYDELELALFEGRRHETVLTPVLGLAFEPTTPEVALGDGLTLTRGDKLPDAPPEAVWGESEEPHVLLVLTVSADRDGPAAVSLARSRFRRTLTALRLFERGGYALAPQAWVRSDAGVWRTVPLGVSGRPRMVTLIPARQEEELRAFCHLAARRAPTGGELAWALGRFEMGCERVGPFEALTDYLLALRALLEPEGPSSGRLAQRLAALCARPEDRAALAERVARTIGLERAVMAGLHPGEAGGRARGKHASAGADALVLEVAEHLRALLRDVICGHLDEDLVGLADRLLAQAADVRPADTESVADRHEVREPDARPIQVTDRRYPSPQAAPYSAPMGPGVSCPPGATCKSWGS